MSRGQNTIKRSEVSTIPFLIKYSASLASNSFDENGITLNRGINTDYNTDGIRFLNYAMIKQMFYQEYITGSLLNSASLWNPNIQSTAASGTFDDDYRYFPTESEAKIAVLAIPRTVFGEQIARNSFRINSSAFDLIDDGNGNVIDTYASNTHVGNILYNQGIVVLTNSDYQYSLISADCDISATVTKATPTTGTTTTTTSLGPGVTTTTIPLVNFDIVALACTGGPGTGKIKISNYTGGGGTYQASTSTHTTYNGALNGTFVNVTGDKTYSNLTNGVKYIAVRDKNNPSNVRVKSLVVSCATTNTTTTTTVSPATTTTTTIAPGTVYVLSNADCGGDATFYVLGNITPVIGKYYKPTSISEPYFNGSRCFKLTGTATRTADASDLVFGTAFNDCNCVPTTTTTSTTTTTTTVQCVTFTSFAKTSGEGTLNYNSQEVRINALEGDNAQDTYVQGTLTIAPGCENTILTFDLGIVPGSSMNQTGSLRAWVTGNQGQPAISEVNISQIGVGTEQDFRTLTQTGSYQVILEGVFGSNGGTVSQNSYARVLKP